MDDDKLKAKPAPVDRWMPDKDSKVGPKRQSPRPSMFALLLLSLAAGFFGGWMSTYRQNGLSDFNNQSTAVKQQIISSESQLISQIAKDVGPSVVSVNVEIQAQASPFFGVVPPTGQGAGTGIIISADGLVATNRHVVPEGTTTVSVTLSDGTELDNVEIVGRDTVNDIAFLRIKDKKGKDLKPAKLGDSSKMQVGDKVVAIGNARGQFQNTVTMGIISGIGRSIVAADETGNSEQLEDLFQTDAAINSGNSGGPLVNMNGEVIGINTAVAQGAENLGFSIPVNDVQGIIKSVVEKGKIIRPYMGVHYVSLTDDFAYEYNLPVKRGAYLAPASTQGQSAIIPGSPAEKAGLKEKDIITKVNGTAIDDKNSLSGLLSRANVGDDVTLTIVRDGKEQEIKVKLEAAPMQ